MTQSNLRLVGNMMCFWKNVFSECSRICRWFIRLNEALSSIDKDLCYMYYLCLLCQKVIESESCGQAKGSTWLLCLDFFKGFPLLLIYLKSKFFLLAKPGLLLYPHLTSPYPSPHNLIYSVSFTSFKASFKIPLLCPSWFGSINRVSAYGLKGPGSILVRGTCPGWLWAQSPVGGV